MNAALLKSDFFSQPTIQASITKESKLQLLEKLNRYGLNPGEWNLDWADSNRIFYFGKRTVEFVRNIRIICRTTNEILFVGDAYLDHPAYGAGSIDWHSIESAEL